MIAKTENSSIKKNYIFNLIYQIFLLAVPLIVTPYISRILLPEGIGKYSFSFSIVTYFTLFASFGFAYYAQREIAKNQDNKQAQSKIFWEMMILKVLTTIASISLFVVLIKVNLLSEYNDILTILILNIISVGLDCTFLLQGHEEFEKIVKANIFVKILSVVSIFVFVKTQADLGTYTLINSLSLVVSNITIMLLCPRYLTKVKFSELNIKRHFVPALKLFIPTIATSIYAMLDKTLIGLITNANDSVGFYEQSEKVAKIALTIVTALSAVMIPNNAKHFASKNFAKVKQNIESAITFSMLIGFPIMFGLMAVANNFVPWFFGPGYEYCIVLIQILSILIISIGLNNVFGVQYLVPVNKENVFTISVIIGAISNLILNIITIPLLGAIGAAISTVVAETIILIYQMIYLRKTFSIKKTILQSIKYLIAGIVMFFPVAYLSRIFAPSILNTLLLILIGAVIYLLMIILLKDKFTISLLRKISNNKVIRKMKKLIKGIVNKSKFYKKLQEIKRQTKFKVLPSNLKINLIKYYPKVKVIDHINYSNYEKIKYTSIDSKYFYYYLDNFVTLYTKPDKIIFGNITMDYSEFLDNSLVALSTKYPENKFVKLVSQEFERILPHLSDTQKKHFENMKDSVCLSFQESLQRILFANQLIWQTGHRLVGLGRLDKLLEKYYKEDISNKTLTPIDAKDMLIEFFQLLHRDYGFKSESMLGDTGQIIILGGLEPDGKYFANDLTYLILDTLTDLNIPDPKILLRVSQKMPDKLLKSAIENISKGTGSPLLSNDDIIINNMIDFGYDKLDAYNYATSACWEVMPIGNAAEINHYKTLNFVQALNKTLEFRSLQNIEELLVSLNHNVKIMLDEIISEFESRTIDEDPLMAFFLNDNKNLNALDPKYTNIGILTVGISNVVNAILNIDSLVFKTKTYTLGALIDQQQSDDVNAILKSNKIRFGNDDDIVIELTKNIMSMVTNYIKTYNKTHNIRIKTGYSSPAYLTLGKNTDRSLDGRKDGEPFNVHISCSQPLAHTELINFASKLDYSAPCINGNVIDFSTTPQLICDNIEKFESLIKVAIKNGFYQMQINVVSSEQLIEAKANPEKFPNLIVRVWGFSAYFNDLSEEYKDILIERTKMYENANK